MKRQRRAYDDRRSLLHAAKLGEFVTWALDHGYRQHPRPQKAAFEVARLELIDPAGGWPHIVIYSRLTGDHLTVCAEGAKLVRRWLQSQRTAA